MATVSGYECQYFYEDEVYCYKEKTGTVQYGIVLENSEYASSDEDDDSENEAPKLKRGQIRVAWYPTGKENVTSENKVSTILVSRVLVVITFPLLAVGLSRRSFFDARRCCCLQRKWERKDLRLLQESEKCGDCACPRYQCGDWECEKWRSPTSWGNDSIVKFWVTQLYDMISLIFNRNSVLTLLWH